MLNLLSASSSNKAMYWMLIILGVLLLIEIAVLAIIMIIRSRNKVEEPRQIGGIVLDTAIVKRDYKIGEQLDPSGLIVTVSYIDEPNEEIINEFTIVTPELIEQLDKEGKKPEDLEECLIYPPDLSVEGKPMVTVTYRGMSAAYAIEVTAAEEVALAPEPEIVPIIITEPEPERTLVAISLDTEAVRKEYTAGDELDLTGLVVYGNYNIEPLTEPITEGYEVAPIDMSQVGMPTVTVTYGEFAIGFQITINPVVVEEKPIIRVVYDPIIIEEESYPGGVLRYDRSFTSRLIQSDDETKQWYTELKNYLLSFKKVKDRMSWKRESYRHGRIPVARLGYRGKTLCIYLPLDPNEYVDTKYKVEDVSDSVSYADTPCMYRLKNERRVKYAMELFDVVMERISGGKRIERESVDYYVPYEGIVELIDKGLIKRVIGKKGAFFESNIDEQQLDEAAATEDEE